MKLKDGLILSQVGGQAVVVPVNEDLDLNTMIKLNETGAFLWKLMQAETTEDALVEALLAEYDVDEATARGCVNRFVGKLRDHGFLN